MGRDNGKIGLWSYRARTIPALLLIVILFLIPMAFVFSSAIREGTLTEALGEGDLGMLMVGNVVVNRVLADCLTFKNIDSVYDAIYQPNQFVGTDSSLFNASATTLEKQLAQRILNGEYYYPATNALWFYAPSGNSDCKSTWYDQQLAGRYKSHCGS